MTYRLLTKGVLRLADNLVITRDMIEWEDYRAWLKGGGVPEPMPLPPGPTLADVLASTKQRITAKRDAIQYGGADVGGVRVKTDAASLAMIDQALTFSKRKQNRVYQVKSAQGKHIPMTAAQIGDVFDALAERVALCWDNEAAHYAAADAIAEDTVLTEAERIAALYAYDVSTGWPE